MSIKLRRWLIVKLAGKEVKVILNVSIVGPLKLPPDSVNSNLLIGGCTFIAPPVNVTRLAKFTRRIKCALLKH